MARRKSEAQPADAAAAQAGAAAPAGKGRNNLIPAVVLAVGLAAAGYLFSSGKGGSASAATPPVAGAVAATPPTTVPEGEIVKLDATTLNLADSHFLKLGLALQLKKGVKPEAYTTKSAKALDLAITLFGGRTYSQLADPKAREQAKDELSKEVTEAYGGEVTEIYLTEFVMQ